MNAAVLAPGSTWDSIRAALASLHPGQRRVAEVLLAHGPTDLARASVSDIAELSGTSPATVVRTCQQLGFSGFRECAMILACDVTLAAGDGSGAPDAEDGTTNAVRFLHEAAAALAHAASSADAALLAAVGSEIAAARRLLVASYGWSHGAAAMFALNLVALGRSVEAPTDPQMQVVTAANLGPGDVCLLVCFTGGHPHAQNVARIAKRTGARVVLITTFSHSLTSESSDINLVFGGRETGEHFSDLPTAGVVQFATLEAVRIAVAAALDIPAQAGLRNALGVLAEAAMFDNVVG